MDFGSVVIGETAQHVIQLRNAGAKGVAYNVCRALDLILEDAHQSDEITEVKQIGEVMLTNQSNETPADDTSFLTTVVRCIDTIYGQWEWPLVLQLNRLMRRKGNLSECL